MSTSSFKDTEDKLKSYTSNEINPKIFSIDLCHLPYTFLWKVELASPLSKGKHGNERSVISEMLLFAITLSSQGLHCLYVISHFFDIALHICFMFVSVF